MNGSYSKNRLLINEEEKNRILNLHKNAILKEYSSIIMEQVNDIPDSIGDSSDFCNVNVANTSTTGFPAFNQVLIKNIFDECKIKKSTSISTYKSWYNKPDTQAKISNKTLLKKLPSFLDKVSKNGIVFYTKPEMSPKPKSIAWVATPKDKNQITTLGDKWGKIYLNVYQLHNGEKYTESLYDVIHHEIGHLIDSFFEVNGENIYLKTHPEYNSEEYKKNYIINDKDQFSRLSVLRGLIGAGPLDNPRDMLTKFMAKVTDGTITSPYFNFSAGSAELDSSLFKKNTTQEAIVVNSFLHNRIIVNNLRSGNIEQLFATFSFIKSETQTIYVNFNLLSDLNITTAKIENDSEDGSTVTEEKIFESEEKTRVYFLMLKSKTGNLERYLTTDNETTDNETTDNEIPVSLDLKN